MMTASRRQTPDMNRALPIALLGAAVLSTASARAPQDNPKPTPAAPNLSGLHDFDHRVGRWTAHHRRLRERLAGSTTCDEFDGTQVFWQVMDGYGNVDDNVLELPSGTYRGVTLRAYDAKSGEWAIWWLDGRTPFGSLEPPVKGRFENGVGAFYANDTLRGKPIRVRFLWSGITPEAAHWEQAFSPDGGKTWETNWVTDFRKAP
jgi:hypothetical protein